MPQGGELFEEITGVGRRGLAAVDVSLGVGYEASKVMLGSVSLPDACTSGYKTLSYFSSTFCLQPHLLP